MNTINRKQIIAEEIIRTHVRSRIQENISKRIKAESKVRKAKTYLHDGSMLRLHLPPLGSLTADGRFASHLGAQFRPGGEDCLVRLHFVESVSVGVRGGIERALTSWMWCLGVVPHCPGERGRSSVGKVFGLRCENVGTALLLDLDLDLDAGSGPGYYASF